MWSLFRKKKTMATFSINGISIQAGRNITINGDKVMIDGVLHADIEPRTIMEIRIIEGTIENVRSDMSITCGDVTGNVDAGMTVNCGNVGGDVDAGMSVNCGSVGGDVDAGMSVNRR